ncbi:uracil-DNA glycosylase [Pseudochelatococcus contaminans]|uniref:Type-4 uracil-DNA glycosylase n=1 Tax=Pseudochelatococcus contaminans TaxID=1538103 RepID=A0A7W5Z308_9HYPH|nr:uracil-DNA glycosylase [Pseudochelatococcus contaminans]MBB3808711.1 DNA polymerase [Pseudochelatococcus contaminans]
MSESDITDNSPESRAAIAALLDFYVEAGVDIVLDDAPVDRFRESAEARPSAAQIKRQAPSPASPTQPRLAATANASPGNAGFLATADDPVFTAQELARNADTLDALRVALAGFDGCALKKTAKNLVFADGTPQARVMFVGEAPGRDEDLQGKPFVGRSGRLLDLMLAAIGLDRTRNAYIANIVPWRPPGNRTPTPQEAATCHPFIRRQIELCDPDILVCLGGPSVQALLGVKEGILKTRGRWFDYNTGKRDIRALATLHPAYLLRQPSQKRLAWRDFKALRKALGA